MKAIILLLTFFTAVVLAATVSETGVKPTADAQYVVTARDANSRTWSRISLETNMLGEVTVLTNAAFTELATGLHFFDPENHEWIESKAEIQLLADGAAVTTTQYKLAFAADANSPAAIDLTLPDGQRLRTRIAALSYADPKPGKVVIIGEPQSSIGLLTGKDQVIYTNVFTGTEVDLQYVVSLAGLEQNIIWRELPKPSPEELGLSSDSSQT